MTALMTGVAYAASAEIAGEMGAFPGYAANADDMLRVIRNHRRAAHGKKTGYENLSIPPVPLDARHCPDRDLVTAARTAWEQGCMAQGAILYGALSHATLAGLYYMAP